MKMKIHYFTILYNTVCTINKYFNQYFHIQITKTISTLRKLSKNEIRQPIIQKRTNKEKEITRKEEIEKETKDIFITIGIQPMVYLGIQGVCV